MANVVDPACLLLSLAHLLRRCETDFRLQLSATDYGNFLANEPLPLSTAVIADKVCHPESRRSSLIA